MRYIKITLGLLPAVAVAIWIIKWMVIGVHQFISLSVEHGWYPYKHCFDHSGLHGLQVLATATCGIGVICACVFGIIEARKAWRGE